MIRNLSSCTALKYASSGYLRFLIRVIFKITQLASLICSQAPRRLYPAHGLSLTIVLTIRAAKSCRTIQVVASRTLMNYTKSVGRIVEFDRWRIATDRTWLRSFDARVTSTHPPRAGRIASTCLRHGIANALSAIPVTNPSFSPSGEISRFRLTHTISVTHAHTCTRTRNIRAANVALRRLLFHESRLYAIVRSSLRCITTECRKFAVGFVEIELSFALETKMISIEGRRKDSLSIEFSVFDVIEKNAAIYLTAITIFILYMANLYKSKTVTFY